MNGTIGIGESPGSGNVRILAMDPTREEDSMQIQKFYASNLPAAVRDVRRMLGPDAVIMSTRYLTTDDAVIVPSRGSQARVEVTAARGIFEGDSLPRKPARTKGPATPPAPHKDRIAPYGLDAYSPPSVERRMGLGPSESGVRSVEPGVVSLDSGVQNLKSGNWREEKGLGKEDRRMGLGPSIPAPLSPVAGNERQRRIPTKMEVILRELRSLKEALGRSSLQRQDLTNGANGSNDGNGGPDSTAQTVRLQAGAVRESLRAQGVEEALAHRILGRTFQSGRSAEISPWKPGQTNFADDGAVAKLEDFARAVGDFVTGPQQAKTRPTDGCHKIALVGPTGVGKTTTLAKIASYHALRENKVVALVTLDTYRIAAAEQIKTYARLLGVPLEVVWDPSWFAQALERFGGSDYVLIDTPGCSPNDRKTISRLAGMLAQEPGIEVHLVIPSGLRPEEMRGVMEGFRPLGYQRVIFSKLDEAVTWGNLLNTWILDGLDVSYFTMGQRVPEDLEAASLEWLCRALLTSELAPED